MRGLKRDRSAAVTVSGHAFVQNIRRGHYAFGEVSRGCALMDALAEMASTI